MLRRIELTLSKTNSPLDILGIIGNWLPNGLVRLHIRTHFNQLHIAFQEERDAACGVKILLHTESNQNLTGRHIVDIDGEVKEIMGQMNVYFLLYNPETLGGIGLVLKVIHKDLENGSIGSRSRRL